MKPNFAQMSRSELKAYVRRNRDDLEALDILVSRRTPDSEATWYAPMVTAEGVPIEENVRLGEQAIQERIALEREQESIRIVIEAAEALLKSREEKNKINQESRNE
ncbi:DUF6887 family protein [Dolichospermum flos-aquae]|jgi:hypothetical protein|uniref:DUF6887 family protein n=1 Tax=Dolichospermum flosaquae TaxID=1166 RepID=UPI001B37E031|nr:hypothetical protein [Dolichospermum flos-aquae]